MIKYGKIEATKQN